MTHRTRDLGARDPPVVEELVPAPDPSRRARALVGLPYLLFLDSATARDASRDLGGRDRYSFLAADPALIVRSKAGRAVCIDQRNATHTPVARQRARRSPSTARAVHAPPDAGLAAVSGRRGGLHRLRLGRGRSSDSRARATMTSPSPDVVFGIYDWVLAWDHEATARGSSRPACPMPVRRAAARAQRRLSEMRQRLAQRNDGLVGVPRADQRGSGMPRAPSYPRTGCRRGGGHRAAVVVHPPRLPRRGRARARVHPRRRHLPGEPVAALRSAAARVDVVALPALAHAEPRAVRRVPRPSTTCTC